MNGFNEMLDVFFNGRTSYYDNQPPVRKTEEKSAVTVSELIRRKSSLVLVDGVLYKITCEPVDIEKLK